MCGIRQKINFKNKMHKIMGNIWGGGGLKRNQWI